VYVEFVNDCKKKGNASKGFKLLGAPLVVLVVNVICGEDD
jgi:hypothetical protein